MACDLKMTGCRVKPSEISDSGILVDHIEGTFDLVVLKVIFGAFRTIVLKWPVSRFSYWIMWEDDTLKF